MIVIIHKIMHRGDVAQEVRAVVWQSEGCRFDPTLGVLKCPWARHLTPNSSWRAGWYLAWQPIAVGVWVGEWEASIVQRYINAVHLPFIYVIAMSTFLSNDITLQITKETIDHCYYFRLPHALLVIQMDSGLIGIKAPDPINVPYWCSYISHEMSPLRNDGYWNHKRKQPLWMIE